MFNIAEECHITGRWSALGNEHLVRVKDPSVTVLKEQ
jgi:hypothetical protein